MKKLSELVAYKTQLEELTIESAQTFVNSELGKITHLLQDEIVNQQLSKINQELAKFNTLFDHLKQNLRDQISEAERPWIQEGYDRYDKGETNYFDDILNGRPIDSVNSTPFETRLLKYTTWKHPAMIIRPGLDSFINSMVAYDPLYLVDLSHDFLRPAIERFHERYQHRLRTYVVKEDIDTEILKQLPSAQFGLCIAFNYFNFRPFEIIKKYLEEIYQKLTPGGVFVFTFNDCDRQSAVQLVEQHFCCYTPGHLIRELIATVGYDIVYSWHNDGPTTWIEIRRPGTFESLRAGPTMAKILPKPVA